MTTEGVTPTGFISPTSDQIANDISDDLLGAVSATLNTAPTTPLGQIIGVFAARLALAWEALATAYNAVNPNAAEGPQLANDAALTGVLPQVATFGTVVLNMNLNATTTVNPGAIAAVAGQPSNQWVLVGATQATPGSSVASTTAGVYQGFFRASTTGPVPANANTITSIVTSVSGWTGVNNPLAATPGVAADTDTTLRQRQQTQGAVGSGTLPGIEAAVAAVTGVISVSGAENDTLFADVNGVPGKSIHIQVWDGAVPAAANNAIAQAIWSSKGAGIQSFGAQSGVAVDSKGNSQIIFFDRVTQIPIYVTLTTTPGTLTTAQTATIKANLAAYFLANVGVGASVVALPLRSAALLPGVVTDIPTFFLGTAPSPAGTGNIAISSVNAATLSTVNILVNGI